MRILLARSESSARPTTAWTSRPARWPRRTWASTSSSGRASPPSCAEDPTTPSRRSSTWTPRVPTWSSSSCRRRPRCSRSSACSRPRASPSSWRSTTCSPGCRSVTWPTAVLVRSGQGDITRQCAREADLVTVTTPALLGRVRAARQGRRRPQRHPAADRRAAPGLRARAGDRDHRLGRQRARAPLRPAGDGLGPAAGAGPHPAEQPPAGHRAEVGHGHAAGADQRAGRGRLARLRGHLRRARRRALRRRHRSPAAGQVQRLQELAQAPGVLRARGLLRAGPERRVRAARAGDAGQGAQGLGQVDQRGRPGRRPAARGGRGRPRAGPGPAPDGAHGRALGGRLADRPGAPGRPGDRPAQPPSRWPRAALRASGPSRTTRRGPDLGRGRAFVRYRRRNRRSAPIEPRKAPTHPPHESAHGLPEHRPSHGSPQHHLLTAPPPVRAHVVNPDVPGADEARARTAPLRHGSADPALARECLPRTRRPIVSCPYRWREVP